MQRRCLQRSSGMSFSQPSSGAGEILVKGEVRRKLAAFRRPAFRLKPRRASKQTHSHFLPTGSQMLQYVSEQCNSSYPKKGRQCNNSYPKS